MKNNLVSETDKFSRSEGNLSTLFINQVKLTPKNIAILENGKEISYQELQNYALQIGKSIKHHLKAQTYSGSHRFIGILLPQGYQYISSELAIFLSGKICVPLSIEYQLNKLELMLKEFENPLVITLGDILDQIGLDYKNTILLESEFEDSSSSSSSALNIIASDHNQESLAFAYYTSGTSTGKPKSVLISHSAYINFVEWSKEYFQFKESDVSLLFLNPAFSLTIQEIWPILLSGGKLIVPPVELRYNIKDLRKWVLKHEITMITMVSSVAEKFFSVENPREEFSPKLRAMFCAGERMSIRPPTGSKFNLCYCYGNTETLGVSFTSIEPGMKPITSVGKPFPGVKVLIIDEEMRNLKSNEIGEICVTGGFLASGYYNRPDLNAEKFIEIQGEVYYKTGDIGYIDGENGNLTVKGRKDLDQIKIRGYTVQLNEIQDAAEKFPGIERAVVAINKSTQIVLFYKLVPKFESFETSEFIIYLENNIPHYAYPSVIRKVDNIPLSANGKVDRNELLKLAMNEPFPQNDSTLTPPITDTEKCIAQLWSKILGISLDTIMQSDNFFGLGGNSILASKFITELKNQQYNTQIFHVFKMPVLKNFAQFLDEKCTKCSIQQPGRALRNSGSEDYFPLSYAQEQLWLQTQQSQQNQNANKMYSHLVSFSLPKEINKGILEQVVEIILNENEILRTSIHEVDGVPCQKVNPINQKDVLQCASMVTAASIQEFDLEKGPLVKFVFNSTKNQLDVHYHHIIMDEIGVLNLQQELEKVYGTILQNNGIYASTPKFQYRDFIEWEKSERDTKEHNESLDFWTKYLTELTPLDFPNDKGRLSLDNITPNIVRVKLSPALSSAIKDFAVTQNTTTFNTLLASTFTLLYRFTQQTDITIITANDGRELTETIGMIGHTVNMIPIRINQEEFGKLKFVETLQLVQQNLIQLLEHRTTPIQQIIQSLGISTKDTGLFDIAIGLVRNNNAQDNFNFFKRLPMDHQRRNTIHNLFFNYEEIENQFIFNIEFNSKLYSLTRIENMSKNLETLLSQVFLHQDSKEISRIKILSEQDVKNLREWNNTEGDFDPNWNLIELFREACYQYPENIAIENDNGVKITYSSLLHKSEALAKTFIQTGSCTSEFIATLLPQGVELLTTILAGFMSGKIIVPLSVDYTIPKLTTMLEQLNKPMLITTEQVTKKVGLEYGNTTYFSEGKYSQTTSHQLTPKYNKIAFGYFTSGSTGVPKLAMVKHAAIVNLVRWFVEHYEIKSTDISSLFVTPSFDASLVDIWPFLSSGSKLIVPPPEYRYSMSDLRNWTKLHGVTCMNFSVAVAEEFYNCAPHELSSTIRWIFFGGDKLTRPPPIGMPFRANLFYGVTEATCCSTYKIINPDEDKQMLGLVHPSGIPLRNVEIIILDDNLEPVPIGVCGEVCIAGISIAEGYYNRDEMNREKFIPHPIEKGKKIYRSGDLGAWLPEGELLLKGRKDFDQIKIRGFRIELGEIQRLICHYSPTIQKVVILPERNPEDLKVHQIHAFCKISLPGHKDNEHLSSDIRNYLLHHLPHYAVPNTITILAEFPLTTNGKIDKETLMKLKSKNVNMSENTEKSTPMTKVESAMVSIWANVLNVPADELCVTDNFFEMGGNSLLIGKIISIIKHDPTFQNFNLNKLTTANFFGSPTIEALARIIEEGAEYVENIDMHTPEEYKVDLNLSLEKQNTSGSILLTGATGYLGGCLLTCLLSETSNTAKIYCLIRGSEIQEARNRLAKCLKKFNYKLDEAYIDRIRILAGDLTKDRFGLDETTYDLLCDNIGKIYHSAAEVNFLQSYEQLKEPNVNGTFNILKFAAENKIKQVHYVSTVGVFGYNYLFGNEKLDETTEVKFHDTEIGYSKSKWVAENVIKDGFSLGIPGNIYRPGTIGCHSTQDIKNVDDFLGLMFRCCKEIGFYPNILWKFPYSTVDSTCKMIVNLSLKSAEGNIYHTFDKQLCFSQFFKHFDYAGLIGLTLEEWKSKIMQVEMDNCSEFILGMQSLIGTKFYKELTFFDLPHDRSVTICNTITKSNLSIDSEEEGNLIKRYFDVVYSSL